MIFYNYRWQHYIKATDNPAAAINLLLKLKNDVYKVIRICEQLIIRKVKVRD
jgi:hypothetical protein